MQLHIRHETIYRYDQPVHDSHNEVRLQPLNDELQHCLSYQLQVEPRAPVRRRPDYFGNVVQYFSIPGSHHQLKILAEALVATLSPPFLGPPRDRALALGVPDDEPLRGSLVEYLVPSRYVPLSDEIRDVADELERNARGDGARFWDLLLEYFHQNLTYETGSTTVDDDALAVLRDRRGVCQDFAHLSVALARAARIPARYVSGYVNPRDEPAVASHAWAELYLPGAGWVGFDASAAGSIDERYVRVAYGLDYGDANPVRGTFSGGGMSALHVDVRVQEAQQQ